MTFAEQIATVRGDLEALRDRAVDLADLRRKQGKALGQEARQALLELADCASQLRALAEGDAESDAEAAELRDLAARYTA